LLVQDGDPYAMAGAIIEMRENRGRAVSYGKNAQKKALIRHDKNKIVNNLLNIYRGVLELENQKSEKPLAI